MVLTGFLKLIHIDLKDIIISSLEKVLSTIKKDKVVTNIDQLQTEELKRQYLALERGIVKFKLLYDIDLNSEQYRTGKGVDLIRKCYFTIMNYDANYQIISSIILNEYAKIRGWINE